MPPTSQRTALWGFPDYVSVRAWSRPSGGARYAILVAVALRRVGISARTPRVFRGLARADRRRARRGALTGGALPGISTR